MWEEARVPVENPPVQAGDYHTISHTTMDDSPGSNSGRSGDKRAHCPLDTTAKLISFFIDNLHISNVNLKYAPKIKYRLYTLHV